MRILLVEDEKPLANFVQRGLKEEHFAVDTAYDGEKALEMLAVNPYDLVILDLMLPEKDGLDICKDIRRKNMDVPVLMVTARGSVKDKVTGLNSGADDYLPKPFAFEELQARVHALLRRNRTDKSPVLKVGGLELNQLTHQVKRDGTLIELTSREYALLEYLMLNAGHTVTRTMISEHVWNESFDTFTNVIDVYINYLRNKIDKGFSVRLLHTLRGTGYVLREGGDD